MLPNAPFDRLNLYVRAEIYIEPFIRICPQTWKFERQYLFIFAYT